MRGWRNRQTRWIQVPVPARAWGFNSPLAHRGTPTKGVSPHRRNGRASISRCPPILLLRTRERGPSAVVGVEDPRLIIDLQSWGLDRVPGCLCYVMNVSWSDVSLGGPAAKGPLHGADLVACGGAHAHPLPCGARKAPRRALPAPRR